MSPFDLICAGRFEEALAACTREIESGEQPQSLSNRATAQGGATLEEFAPRFIEGHAWANRQKPSGTAAKQSILAQHPVPELGGKKLDAITTENIQQLKSRLTKRSNKTVNNILTVLNTLLKKAVESDVIDPDAVHRQATRDGETESELL